MIRGPTALLAKGLPVRSLACVHSRPTQRRLAVSLEGSALPVQNIYCIGRNYVEHAYELGNEAPKEEPVVFLKSLSSLRGLKGYSAFVDKEGEVHHEVELVVQIGNKVPFGSKAGWEVVSSLALGLDLTRREKQSALKKKGLPWTLAKNFVGSGILSSFVGLEHFESEPPYANLGFSLSVNGVLRQKASLGQMIFPVPELIAFLASHQPLEPGDLIFTGTPKGVGPIISGDEFCMVWTSGIRNLSKPLEFKGVI